MNSKSSWVLQNGIAIDGPMGWGGPYQCPLCDGTDALGFLVAPDRFHWRSKNFHLVRCVGCACVWLFDPPSPLEMPYHYDEEYHRTITTAGETDAFHRWKRHRRLVAEQKRSGSLLDIGCSSGSFLSTMKGEKWKLYGVELEASTAEQARAVTGAEIFVGNVADAPFQDESFDVVTCFDVLEHVYDPRLFLATVYRWLKPGGIFFLVLPNIDSLESRIFRTYWYGLELPRHLFHFCPKSLRYIMTSTGFKEVQLATGSCYIERSVGYLSCALSEAMGLSLVTPSSPREESFAWKVLRKVMRLVFVQPLARIAALAGAGPSIEAIFVREP